MRILIPAAFVLALVAVPAGQTTRTVWDGVYTTEQATRGAKLYASECTRCHGDNLLGGEAPALAGPLFANNWENVPLSDLHDRIRTTMPQDNPGNLSRQDVSDIVAHMLSVAKMPAGTTPLGTDAAALQPIKYVSNRPQ